MEIEIDDVGIEGWIVIYLRDAGGNRTQLGQVRASMREAVPGSYERVLDALTDYAPVAADILARGGRP